MTAYYAEIKINGKFLTTKTVKPNQSIGRRAILERAGLALKGHTVSLYNIAGNHKVAK